MSHSRHFRIYVDLKDTAVISARKPLFLILPEEQVSSLKSAAKLYLLYSAEQLLLEREAARYLPIMTKRNGVCLDECRAWRVSVLYHRGKCNRKQPSIDPLSSNLIFAS